MRTRTSFFFVGAFVAVAVAGACRPGGTALEDPAPGPVEAPAAAPAEATLITTERIGPVRLGMTFAEVRRAVPDARLHAPEDAFFDSVQVLEGETVVLEFLTEEMREARWPQGKLPEDTQVVAVIRTNDARFRTAEGVRVGTLLRDAEAEYGPPHLEFWPHGEEATFPEAFPKGVAFDVGPIPHPDGNKLAGIYTEEELRTLGGETREYKPEAVIRGINIFKQLPPDTGARE